jgi:hypothetical protein
MILASTLGLWFLLLLFFISPRVMLALSIITAIGAAGVMI